MAFLKRSAVGVSVTDEVLEIVELATRDGIPSVAAGMQVSLKPSVVENGRIVNSEALKEVFTEALKGAKPAAIATGDITCSLPMQHAYSGVVFIKKGSEDARKKAVEERIRRTVPLAPKDVLYAYGIIGARDEKKETGVFFVAASKAVVMEWRTFFRTLKINASFVFGPLAAYRTLSFPSSTRVTTIADASSAAATVSVFENDTPYYSFGRAFGEDSAMLAEEVKHAAAAVHDVYGKEVDAVMLVPPAGGTDIRASLEKALGVSVALPTIQVAGGKTYRPVTLGAALRALDEKTLSDDPVIIPGKAHILNAHAVQEQESRDDIASTRTAVHVRKKFRRQLIMLGVLVLIGAGITGGAWWLETNKQQTDTGNGTTEQSPAATTSDQSSDKSMTATSTNTTATTTPEISEEAKQTGVVLDTPTGYLNVRSGPGTEYEQTDRISPGDSYTILEAEDNWYKIELSEEKTGWVFSEYIGIE